MDYLGIAATLKYQAKDAIKEKDLDKAWKLLNKQKEQYLKPFHIRKWQMY